MSVGRDGDAAGAEAPRGSRPQGGAAGASALPCLSYNNSIGDFGETGSELAPFEIRRKANEGRRLAFQAVGLVGDFVRYWGHVHCAVWTLTAKDVPTPREFAARWNSLRTNELDWLKGYLRFLEPQQRGSPHYHILAAVGWDMLPQSFDWGAHLTAKRKLGESAGEFKQRRRTAAWFEAKRNYVASSAPETRSLWGQLRKVLPKYGFERSEFLPLRDKTGAAVYMGGYLRTGVAHRFGAWKGARLIEADRVTSLLWRNHGRQFMFNQCAERIWRHQLSVWAKMVGCVDTDEIALKFGSRWCFHYRDRIMQIDAPDIEFTAVNQDGKPRPKVNLWSYQLVGRVAHAAAFAEANGMSQAEAWNYLFQRGTIFDCTAFTNPAIREEVLLLSARARRLELDVDIPGESDPSLGRNTNSTLSQLDDSLSS